MNALNLWLIELCDAGILPGEWLCAITQTVDNVMRFLGLGPVWWG